MPECFNDPELLDLVDTYQVHVHSRTCWKYNKNECRLSYSRYFTEMIIIPEPLDTKFSNDKNQDILTRRNKLLRQQTAILTIILILRK